MCDCVCAFYVHTCEHKGVGGSQKRVLDPLELELQALWAARLRCWELNSVLFKTADMLNVWATFLAPVPYPFLTSLLRFCLTIAFSCPFPFNMFHLKAFYVLNVATVASLILVSVLFPDVVLWLGKAKWCPFTSQKKLCHILQIIVWFMKWFVTNVHLRYLLRTRKTVGNLLR